MTYTLIASGTQTFDNAALATPLNWVVALDRLLTITSGAWDKTGQLQLQLQVFFSITTNSDVARPGTERFLNPDQSQLGYWSSSSDGFVIADDRIKYSRQCYTYTTPNIQLQNTSNDAPQRFGLNTETELGHAQTITSVGICGSGNAYVVPAPGVSGYDGDFSIGDGGICLRVSHGAMGFSPVESAIPSSLTNVSIDVKSFSAPDQLSGVIWGGQSLEVGWLWGHHEATCTTERTPVPPIVQGGGQFLPVTYTCIAGIQAPVTPLPCVQDEIRLEYVTLPDGRVIPYFTCGGD